MGSLNEFFNRLGLGEEKPEIPTNEIQIGLNYANSIHSADIYEVAAHASQIIPTFVDGIKKEDLEATFLENEIASVPLVDNPGRAIYSYSGVPSVSEPDLHIIVPNGVEPALIQANTLTGEVKFNGISYPDLDITDKLLAGDAYHAVADFLAIQGHDVTAMQETYSANSYTKDLNNPYVENTSGSQSIDQASLIARDMPTIA